MAKEKGILEAILVSTSPSYESDMQRAEAGIYLYEKNTSRKILILGNIGSEYFEKSQIWGIKNKMLEEDIPEEKIYMDTRPTNTREKVYYVSETISEEGIEKLIIVSDLPHIKRFEMLFEKAKGKNYVPKSLEVEGHSIGIDNTYGLMKASIAFFKDSILPLKPKNPISRT